MIKCKPAELGVFVLKRRVYSVQSVGDMRREGLKYFRLWFECMYINDSSGLEIKRNP